MSGRWRSWLLEVGRKGGVTRATTRLRLAYREEEVRVEEGRGNGRVERGDVQSLGGGFWGEQKG